MRFVINDDVNILEAGDAIYIPAHAVHTYIVESAAARAVGMGLSDGRFADLQRQAAPLMALPDGTPMDQLMALTAAHEVSVVGPPLSLAEASGAGASGEGADGDDVAGAQS